MRCATCGQTNPSGQKFCGECGSLLPSCADGADRSALRSYTPPHLAARILNTRSALEGERKPVTVLFCDIADSTAIAERLGPERMHGLLNAFFETALAEIHRYEGTVNQFLGDGFMALFGAPLSQEDHARRAVLAALAIRHAIASARFAIGVGELRLRMGLNSGAVVVGRIGDALRMDYTAIGDTTNVAARLQQHAQPGSILVSELVRRSTQGHASFRELGNYALKGRTEAVSVYELIAAHPSHGAQRHEQSAENLQTLIGRRAELSAIDATLERPRVSGQGGIICLFGDAGLGKSRLLDEARRLARVSGLRWLQGDCLSFGRTLSYWPFREVLRCAFGIDELDGETAGWLKVEAGMRELFGGQADELLPYIGTLLAIALPAPMTQRVRALDSNAIGHQIFRAALLTFERSARRQPLVVALEDWHWADASSAALLEHLLPLSDRVPLLFVIAGRPQQQGPTARLRAAASADADPRLEGAQVVDLSPLPAVDSEHLAVHLLGGGTLSKPLHDMLLGRAEGNPFYLGELVRTLLATRIIERDGAGEWRITAHFGTVPLPDTIEGVILARIDRLEDEVKQVLKAAAVIGRTFFHRVLAAVTEAGNDLDADIGKLRAAELIAEKQLAPELEYVFKHPLIQQATYDSLLEDRRRQLHRLVGQSIEALFEDRLEPFHAMLAYHYAKGDDPQKAREYLFKAADQADRLAADEEALELYNAVIADAERSPLRGLSELQRAELDVKIGDAHFRAGRHQLALNSLGMAAQRLGDPPPKSRLALGVAAASGLLAQWARPTLSRWFATASRPVGESDAIACRVWETMAWIHFFTDQLHQLYDCLRIAQISAGDPTVRPHTIGLSVMGVVFSSIGAYPTATWFHERASATAQRYCDAATQAHALFFEGMHRQATGQLRRAIELHDRAAELSWAAGDIRLWASTTSNLFFCLHRAGQPRMFDVADRFEQVVAEAADRHARAWSLTASAMVQSQRGRYDEALAVLDRTVAVCREIPEHRALAHALGLRAANLRMLDRLGEAERCAVEAVHLLTQHRLTGIFSTVPLIEHAEISLALLKRSPKPNRAKLRETARAIRRALRQGRRVHDDGAVESQRLAGEFKFFCGDVARANEAWSAGLRNSEVLETVPARARLLESRGRLCRQLGDLEEAGRLYEQCGSLEARDVKRVAG